MKTKGWDIVCMIRSDHVNKAIEQKKTYPAKYICTYTDDGITANLNGEFNPWKISAGGDGSNINLDLPLKNGKLGCLGKLFDLTGGRIIVQIKLAYFPEVLKKAKDGSYELKASPNSESPDIPVVSIINYIQGKEKISDIYVGILKTIIGQWRMNNLAAFDAVFSSVMLNRLSESKDFKWLKSSHMSYAYTDTGSLESSIFGVLCMTNERPADGLSRQITSVCLDKNDISSFFIKKELFAEYHFLPSLPNVFEGASVSDFKMNKIKNGITSTNLKLEKVKCGAIYYQPKVKNFEVFFEQAYIRTRSEINVNISAGIDAVI